ncbi:Na/Pi cotransporter family protein [Pseudomonas sp. MYb185]|uniref:Na/Pi cotransporter family protein n=1 Tax=Pseudomonas sp. MYb185 TaxID=1848729 RepID=UPI000CFE208F|nr:Na/Pi symporter [Pseudomonas sp. MYb185]PRB79010.1 sodium:phosphate symporter [Pseudomonas sp. MYb185]
MRKIVGQVWLPALLLGLLGLMIWSTAVATLAAGVALFVLGIGRLEEGFRAFSGGALERWLKWSTSGLWKSLLVGVVSTAMVQSSTLVTLLGIAFLSAGLINTLGGVGLVLGANLGTTSGAWLIALAGLKLDMAQLSMPMLAFGVFLARREAGNWRGLGLALLGIGLLFLGIDLMKTGFSGFEGAFDLGRYAVEGWSGVLLFVLIGALATVIMQSSHATLVLTLAALAAGQVQYDNALALVIGANLGSTATALFAAIGSNNAGRRIAATHLIFNLVTAGGALLLLHQLMAAVEWLADVGGLAPDAHMLKLAIFHSLYNVFGLALMLPWSFLLVRALERWLPDGEPLPEGGGMLSEQPRTRALYINESALLHADTALKVLDQEVQHLAQLSRQVVGAALYLPSRLAELTPAELHEQVRQPVPLAMREDADALYERHIKGVYADIVDFLSHVDVSLLPEQQQAMLNATTAARDLVSAVKAAKHLQSNLRHQIDSTQPAIREAYMRLREQGGLSLLELRHWLEVADDAEARGQRLEDGEAQDRLFAEAFQRELQQQLRNRELDGWQATSLLNDLHYMLRVRRHLRRGHAGLAQRVSTNEAQRLEQAVSLA